MTEEQYGYVFINECGEFARVVTQNGHGGNKYVIGFTSNINQATIFPTDSAYYGLYLGKKERDELVATCQPLKATETRVVRLVGRKEENGL